MGVPAAVTVVVTAIELLLPKVGDDGTEVAAREADSEDDVVGVCPTAFVMGLVELVELVELVVVVLTVLSTVGVLLPLSVVLLPAPAKLSEVDVSLSLPVVRLVAEHCPEYAQYWSVAQQICPHSVCPDESSQVNCVGAAAAVVEVCVSIEVSVGEAVTGGTTKVDDSEVEGTSVLSSMENRLGEASQQFVPPLSSGRFASQQ